MAYAAPDMACNAPPPTRRTHVESITPRAFAVGDPAMQTHLVEEGFAVVRSAVEQAQLDWLRGLLWEFLEGATRMRRDDVETWGEPFPGPAHLGILSWAGVGQSEFMWRARTAEGVMRSFEVAWGLEPGAPLLSSFDGCAVFRPPALNPSWASQGALSWLHVDQGATKSGMSGVQGALLLYDQDIASGGLVVVPRSHTRHGDILAGLAGAFDISADFLPVSPDAPCLDGLGGASLVHARAGDLLLWDSRTVHASAPASVTAPLPREYGGSLRLSRAAAFVCMVPAQEHLCASPALAQQRAQAAMHWVTTTHWPQDSRGVSQGTQPPWEDLAHLSPDARALVLGLPRGRAALDAAMAQGAAGDAAGADAPMPPPVSSSCSVDMLDVDGHGSRNVSVDLLRDASRDWDGSMGGPVDVSRDASLGDGAVDAALPDLLDLADASPSATEDGSVATSPLREFDQP